MNLSDFSMARRWRKCCDCSTLNASVRVEPNGTAGKRVSNIDIGRMWNKIDEILVYSMFSYQDFIPAFISGSTPVMLTFLVSAAFHMDEILSGVWISVTADAWNNVLLSNRITRIDQNVCHKNLEVLNTSEESKIASSWANGRFGQFALRTFIKIIAAGNRYYQFGRHFLLLKSE